MNLQEKALKIKAVVFDIDGVLTNGQIGYCGETEVKFFHVRDGHRIKMAKRGGLKVGALSGRSGQPNRKRAEELELDFLYEGMKKKGEAFHKLLEEQNLQANECVYIGDDVIDIPVLKKAGIPIVVADAPDYMDEFCEFRTKLPGGHGAVGEAIEWLIREQGKWNELMKRYLE